MPIHMKWGVSAVALMACTAASPSLAQEQIVAAVFGGPHGAAIQSCILDPYQEQSGVEVVVDQGVSTVTVAKLEQQRDNPSIDVAWLDGEVSSAALDSDVFAPIDPEQMENLDNLIDEAVYRKDDGEIWGIGNGYYSVGIVYNADEVETAPTSILDLWNEEYQGAVIWPSMADGSGAGMLVYLAEILGGGIDNLQPAVDKMKELDVAAYYDSGGNASNILTRGEAIVGVLDSGGVWTLADANPFPVEFIIPEEGALASDARIHLIKPSEAAYGLLDYAATPEAAKCIAETYFYGPAVKDVELSEKARARLPWGPEGSIDDLKFSDVNAINAQRNELNDLWNREVVGQ